MVLFIKNKLLFFRNISVSFEGSFERNHPFFVGSQFPFGKILQTFNLKIFFFSIFNFKLFFNEISFEGRGLVFEEKYLCFEGNKFSFEEKNFSFEEKLRASATTGSSYFLRRAASLGSTRRLLLAFLRERVMIISLLPFVRCNVLKIINTINTMYFDDKS